MKYLLSPYDSFLNWDLRPSRGHFWFQFVSSAQFSHSVVRLFATPWTAAHQVSLPITNSWSLLKLMSIESVMPSNHLILCHPLLLLPSIFPSIRVFSNELTLCIRRPKYWSFSFTISPTNEYSVLISFRIDWFDFLDAFELWCSKKNRCFWTVVLEKTLENPLDCKEIKQVNS